MAKQLNRWCCLPYAAAYRSGTDRVQRGMALPGDATQDYLFEWCDRRLSSCEDPAAHVAAQQPDTVDWLIRRICLAVECTKVLTRTSYSDHSTQWRSGTTITGRSVSSNNTATSGHHHTMSGSARVHPYRTGHDRHYSFVRTRPIAALDRHRHYHRWRRPDVMMQLATWSIHNGCDRSHVRDGHGRCSAFAVCFQRCIRHQLARGNPLCL